MNPKADSDTKPAPAQGTATTVSVRLQVTIGGAVQGVGFRPFLYRLAQELGLQGWTANTGQGVRVVVEGPRAAVDAFLLAIPRKKPPLASIQSLEPLYLDPRGENGFSIRESFGGSKTASILPDIATCPDCLRELRDPGDRRYGYPFINCTHCGPRYSIITCLPYDRPHTTMQRFQMCAACQAEYTDPANRRFHAQPNACPDCGPQAALWDRQGKPLATKQEALIQAAKALQDGRILAVKGLGGFHLMVLARNYRAVSELRQRKKRGGKPLAVMAHSLHQVRQVCDLNSLEERLLIAPEAPIVLLRRLEGKLSSHLADCVAPGNPYLGMFLPYTPLHHLLLDQVQELLVATSGNLSDEPICTDENDALDRLAGLADFFLVHNRPIARHVDDSVACIMGEREMLLRRARGYAPLPVQVPALPETVLATGAHLKNTLALGHGSQALVSQHIGDLDTRQSLDAFHNARRDLQALYEAKPQRIICDRHPDYASTRWAKSQHGLPVTEVQHHLAHTLACMADNNLEPPALGVSWDGTGLGTDGTIWGGEFLTVQPDGWQRIATLRPFPLAGGDQAAREPRRSALGLMYAHHGPLAFTDKEALPLGAFSLQEAQILQKMLEQKLQTTWTSSVGRLFDAVASLLGLVQENAFEGQAAMALEFACTGLSFKNATPYPVAFSKPEKGLRYLETRNMLECMQSDIKNNRPVGKIALRFHLWLAHAILELSRLSGLRKVVLSGGCFQNRVLTNAAIGYLRDNGFNPYWHQRVPPNDGGIALGQVMAALVNPQSKEGS